VKPYELKTGCRIACNVHSFAVGGAIVLRRPWRRVLNGDTKDKILFKSQIDKCQPVQKLNRITGDERRFASPPRCRKTACCLLAFLFVSMLPTFKLCALKKVVIREKLVTDFFFLQEILLGVNLIVFSCF
jgi:hypothetical protein